VVKIQVSAKGARMQWQHRVGEGEFTDIPGATRQVLEFGDVTVEKAGEYRFIVSSSTGDSITSQITTVTVDTTFIKITEGPVAGTAGISALMPAWGDFNNDGYVDLIISDEGSYEPPQAAVPLIFINQQNGTFRRAGVAEVGPLAQSAMIGGMAGWGDYDNDGYLDFYQSREENGLHSVWRGLANGQFTLVTDSIGINEVGDTWGYSWVDYDQDGFLDLNLSLGAASLFHNLGNGAFERLPAVTFPRITGHQFNYWADYDLDGDPDVILCVGESGSRLYRNEGNGQFTDVTTPVISASGWHACWADFDNDGDFDLCAAGAWSYPSGGIFRNDGNGQFSRLTGTDMPDGVFGFWVDYDNDGYLDLCSAHSIREGQKQGLRMWRNLRDGTLSEVDLGSVTADGSGAAGWGDFDNNGFLDLVVARRNGLATDLYKNNGNTNHWLMIKPVGTASNRSAIGVKVWAEATLWGKPVRLLRQLSGGMAQNDGRVHLGLGDAANVDTLRIEWPSGIVQELQDVAVDQILQVVESQGLILPELLSIQTFELDATGVFHATANCSVDGAVCVLESSSDLERWTKVRVGTSSGGTVELTDARAGDSPGKFYRVLVP
jgi:enediyne biosynthesis protein E4